MRVCDREPAGDTGQNRETGALRWALREKGASSRFPGWAVKLTLLTRSSGVAIFAGSVLCAKMARGGTAGRSLGAGLRS
eukprot:12639140-Alexandrium_andersonii.AAC.1